LRVWRGPSRKKLGLSEAFALKTFGDKLVRGV